ncbi:PhoU family transcriptional regulator [Sporosarcina highlanderae]|uniref:PhoU family transcriptional regulator n=1 Tax=Sporosarcina highlanderae TaxID=3035916 RepID=A0ABT8JQJ8_9BACL|nr:PhoU family transcriptional regulator [Sporosarcina highlanderae]MDN4606464.1 PhoU family transcriptional regulator [Sporosarcina highlanderae]
MKRILLALFFCVLLVGCSKENGESDPILTKEFIETHAEVGLSKTEVEEIFGKDYFSGEGEFETNEVWVYDRVSDDYKYEISTQIVPFDAIRKEHVDYQLYVNFVEESAFMYLFIYKGSDGELWQYQVNPDGTDQERKM